MTNEKGIADYDPNEDWEEHLERLSSRGRDAMAEYDEALKHEIWSCQVGDHLVQTAPLDLWDRDDEAPTIYPPDGQVYRVDELKGR